MLSNRIAVEVKLVAHPVGQRTTGGLDQQAALYPGFASVGGIGSDVISPKRALPIAASAACHSQWTPPSSAQALSERDPDLVEETELNPTLERAMDRTIVREVSG
jgi:hypothetical protein